MVKSNQIEKLSLFMERSYGSTLDYNDIMPMIRKVNSLSKGIQFAIFKTYVSCTVETGGKFYKNFSFSHSEYITENQTDIEAMVKLLDRFVSWYFKNNLEI